MDNNNGERKLEEMEPALVNYNAMIRTLKNQMKEGQRILGANPPKHRSVPTMAR